MNLWLLKVIKIIDEFDNLRIIRETLSSNGYLRLIMLAYND